MVNEGCQETSREAYHSVQPKLVGKRKEVLNCLVTNGNMTNGEVADFLHWPINTVTPRMNELVKDDYVVAVNWKIGPTGRKAIVWGVKNG